VEEFSREHFLIGQKLSRQNWQSACYRASLIKTFTQYRTTKRIKELKEHNTVRTVQYDRYPTQILKTSQLA
jgi:hypothetical protein